MKCIGYDLRSIVKEHPQFAEVLQELCGASNPPFLYGIETTEAIIKRNAPKVVGGLLEVGETNQAADQRRAHNLLLQSIIPEARQCGAPPELEALIRKVPPTYFEGARGALNGNPSGSVRFPSPALG